MVKMGASPNLRIILEPTKDGILSYLPYPHNQVLDGTKIGIAHCDRPGAKRDNGTLIHTDMDWDEDITYVIGHNHTKQRIKNTWYPGTPWQVTFGEQPDKEWAIIEWEDKPSKKLSFKYKAIPIVLPYTLINLKVDRPSQLKKLEKAPTYYKLTLEPGVELPKNLLVKYPNITTRLKVQQKLMLVPNEQGGLDSVEDTLERDLTHNLYTFMMNKGLTEQEAKKGLRFAKKAISKLRLAS
jgi:hypothetical protein